jgi:mRNA interferase RelE/StbE
VTWTVAFTKGAEREIARLDRPVQARILQAPVRLEEDPFTAPNVKALRGGGDGYRLRVGDHRVLYQVLDERVLVLVVKVGHRREVYR